MLLPLLCLIALGSAPSAAPAVAVPVPVPGEPFPTKTITVKTDGAQFNVSGRTELPRNAKIALLRKAQVLGTARPGDDGKVEDAVLEVSGTLELKAVTGGRVELRNVWIELTPECRSLYLTDVRFIGGGGIRASKKGPSTADVFIEKVEFLEGASFAMECAAGTITVSSTHSKEPVSLIGAARSEKAESKAKIRVTGCKGGRSGSWRGMMGGLEVSGAKQALVTFCHLEGGTSRFADNGKLSFEGNNVRSQFIEFAYAKPGRFKRATISGCDFRSKEISFLAPLNGGKTERLTVKDCWFSSGTEPEAVLKQQVRDVTRSDETSAEVSIKKIKERPIGLGGQAGG